MGTVLERKGELGGEGWGSGGGKGVEVGGADDGDRAREHGAGWTESGPRKVWEKELR